MCLSIVFRGKEKKAALAKLSDKITVWKILAKPYKLHPNYRTELRGVLVCAGEVKFKQNMIRPGRPNNYRGGGHFWLKRNKRWGVNWDCKLVQCTIKKSDINTIGIQNGHPVVVVKKATFPKYIGKKR